MATSLRIAGIDPGSRKTGFACIEAKGDDVRVLECGTWDLLESAANFENRLLNLQLFLQEFLKVWRPQVMVVEKVFFAKNALSALKLGQSRGVVLLCAAQAQMEVRELSPTQVKQSIVGHGRAEKHQVADVLRRLFEKNLRFATHDASDALALALGGHRMKGQMVMDPFAKKKKRSLAECVLAPADLARLKRGV